MTVKTNCKSDDACVTDFVTLHWVNIFHHSDPNCICMEYSHGTSTQQL